MAVAVSLQDAADKTSANLFVLWAADTLSAKAVAFATAANAIFPDQISVNHPMGNWTAVIGSLAPAVLPFVQQTAGLNTIGLNTVATYGDVELAVFRMFSLAAKLNAQTPQQITNAQATALLAAYNLQFS